MPPKKFNEETCQCLVENYSKGLPLKYCADIAGIARIAVRGIRAIDGTGKNFGNRGFAGAADACQQIGMGNAVM